MIPWSLFLLWSEAIPHLDAGHELAATRVAAYGAALTAGTKDKPALDRYVRRLTTRAHPLED